LYAPYRWELSTAMGPGANRVATALGTREPVSVVVFTTARSLCEPVCHTDSRPSGVIVLLPAGKYRRSVGARP
jgi:hypothetical protein